MTKGIWLVIVAVTVAIIGILSIINFNWPANFIFGFIAVVGVGFLLRQAYKSKSKFEETTPPDEGEGEVKIRRIMEKNRRDAMQLLGCVAASIFIVLTSVFSVFLVGLPWVIISGFVAVVGAVATYIFTSRAIRPMADLGWWFVRCPEMSVAIIEKDNACWRIIINCNAQKRRDHFYWLCKARNKGLAVKNHRYILLPKGEGLYFLGWNAWPWQYRLHAPWYENAKDQENPKQEPHRYVDLRERSWNYDCPTVGTHDPLDIDAKHYTRVVVWDPYQVVYATVHVGESCSSEIAARWRRVVANLFYFASKGSAEGAGDDEADVLEINPSIQQQAHVSLLADIGLIEKPNDNVTNVTEGLTFFKPYIDKDGEIKNPFPQNSAAEICLMNFGILFLDTEVVDIEPHDKAIWQEMQKKIMSLAEGANALAAARGHAKAAEKEAAGKAKAIEIVAGAEAKALEVRGTAVQRPGGAHVLNADVQREVADKVNNLVVVGPTGTDLAGLVAQATAVAGATKDPVTTAAESSKE